VCSVCVRTYVLDRISAHTLAILGEDESEFESDDGVVIVAAGNRLSSYPASQEVLLHHYACTQGLH